MSEPLLSLRGVSKSYWRGPREISVLADVSLDLYPARMVAVWGEHRSGKTTLLQVAAGLERPTNGVVRFDGRDLAGMSASELAGIRREQMAWGGPPAGRGGAGAGRRGGVRSGAMGASV
jgi:ABC-type lipoprotein export system ATPase subunit